MAIALEKPGFVTQESGHDLERFNFDTTLNQIKQSHKGKRPPEQTEAIDQKENAKLCIKTLLLYIKQSYNNCTMFLISILSYSIKQ